MYNCRAQEHKSFERSIVVFFALIGRSARVAFWRYGYNVHRTAKHASCPRAQAWRTEVPRPFAGRCQRGERSCHGAIIFVISRSLVHNPRQTSRESPDRPRRRVASQPIQIEIAKKVRIVRRRFRLGRRRHRACARRGRGLQPRTRRRDCSFGRAPIGQGAGRIWVSTVRRSNSSRSSAARAAGQRFRSRGTETTRQAQAILVSYER